MSTQIPSPRSYLRSRELLKTPIETIKGVGPGLLKKLHQIGLYTVEDALFTLPHRYEDRRALTPINRLSGVGTEVFYGEIVSCGEALTSKSRKRIFEVIVRDESGSVSLKWFRYKKTWLEKLYRVGRKAVFIGELKRFGGHCEVHHPDAEFVEGDPRELFTVDSLNYGSILPVYPLTEGFSQKNARKIWREVMNRFGDMVYSALPEEIRSRNNFPSFVESIQTVHFPPNDTDYKQLNVMGSPYRNSLVFEEFFFLELGLALKHAGTMLEEGIGFQVNHKYTKPLIESLPYKLTAAQLRVLGEIKHNMMQPHPMNRLIQGDVGCGKTIVALLAALIAIENRYQVAVVAPTEILAEQHFSQFSQFLKQLGLKTTLLSGSLSAPEKRERLAAIAEGEVDLIVGTHAILQESVKFHSLGLGIIDEQHRFGVKQRAVLRKKGATNPDMLVMTATPIPRTLSMTLYGDLDLSVIDEMPPGRSAIRTKALRETDRRQTYNFLAKELKDNHQVYIVYPLVDESEKIDLADATAGAEKIRNLFPESSVGLLHGKMKQDEKDAVMSSFKRGEIDILVSTTVIEVGIDVSNATLMVIEHAERFGLAQLHQLRGRVGRGSAQGYCILMRADYLTEDGQARMDVMEESTDGFRIAEADLEIRGPGDFLGTRQAGLPDFRVANLLQDGALLEVARKEAFEFVAKNDLLSDPAWHELKQTLFDRWGSRLELASVG